MTFKKITVFALTLFSGASMFAQSGLLNAQSASEIGGNTMEDIISRADGPIAYERVNQNDIIFEKKVWEKIPLNEKANLVYYFPTQETMDRKPLFQILKEAIQKKDITEVYYDDTFRTKIDINKLDGKFYRQDTMEAGIEYYNMGEKIPEEYIVKTSLTARDVKEYRIMGTYYFDRNQGELKYRLIGIAPVVIDINTKGKEYENTIELFWIFFPAARQTLYENYAYNEKNSAMRSSFDYLFNARKFSATIYRTDNLYGDEPIEEYVRDNAMQQLLEADRIKESIRNFEDDLWNY